ncbi:hypothetical protein [Spiroplasma sp. DGKH1]|uniref:hypothetical protein n=1 Tax=Spiroplasma sp. DGKH1 TaxID=3050074 RepID=UPI0034C6B7C0
MDAYEEKNGGAVVWGYHEWWAKIVLLKDQKTNRYHFEVYTQVHNFDDYANAELSSFCWVKKINFIKDR